MLRDGVGRQPPRCPAAQGPLSGARWCITDIPGLELAGEIVGGDADGARRGWLQALGDRVCALVAGGGYAEFCVVPVGQMLPVPAGFSDIEAAALPENFFTVWSNVFDRGRLVCGRMAAGPRGDQRHRRHGHPAGQGVRREASSPPPARPTSATRCVELGADARRQLPHRGLCRASAGDHRRARASTSCWTWWPASTSHASCLVPRRRRPHRADRGAGRHEVPGRCRPGAAQAAHAHRLHVACALGGVQVGHRGVVARQGVAASGIASRCAGDPGRVSGGSRGRCACRDGGGPPRRQADVVVAVVMASFFRSPFLRHSAAGRINHR